MTTGSKQTTVNRLCIASSFRWNRRLMKVEVASKPTKDELRSVSQEEQPSTLEIDRKSIPNCPIARTASKFKQFASSRCFNMKETPQGAAATSKAADSTCQCPCLLRMRKREEVRCSMMNKPFKRKATCVLGRLAGKVGSVDDNVSIGGDTATTARTGSTGRSLPSLDEDETEESSQNEAAEPALKNDRLRFELGALHLMNGDLEKADLCIMDAMQMRITLHGRNHEKVAACHELLGDIAQRRQQMEQAKHRYNVAVNLIRMKRGVRDESVSRILLKLAIVYEELGDEEKAMDARKKGNAALQ